MFGHEPNDTDTIHIVVSHSMWLMGLLMALVFSAAVLNGILLLKIFENRRKIFHHKRFFFIANLAATDFAMALIVGITGILSITRAPMQNEVYMLIQLSVSLATITAMATYAALSGVQYLAIQNPIYYRLAFGSSKCIAIIASCWTFVLFYSVAKVFILMDCMYWCTGVFGWVESSGLGVCLALSVASYVSAWRAALRNVKASAKLSIRQFRVTISIGINLLFYCISTIPLMIWWMILASTVPNLYTYHSITCQIAYCTWFSRTSFHPLVLLVRETAFFQQSSSSTSSQRSSPNTVSFIQTQSATKNLPSTNNEGVNN